MHDEIKTQLVEMNAALADLVEASDTAEVVKTLKDMLEMMRERQPQISMAAPEGSAKMPGHEWHTVFEYDEDGRIVAAACRCVKGAA